MSLVLLEQDDKAQKAFDEKYITSSEVCERLRVTRVAIHIRRKAKKLPGAVTIAPALLTIWERAEIEPYLLEWEQHLLKRRGAMA